MNRTCSRIEALRILRRASARGFAARPQERALGLLRERLRERLGTLERNLRRLRREALARLDQALGIDFQSNDDLGGVP